MTYFNEVEIHAGIALITWVWLSNYPLHILYYMSKADYHAYIRHGRLAEAQIALHVFVEHADVAKSDDLATKGYKIDALVLLDQLKDAR